MSFWQELEKPIFALAPLANVTDAAFRRIIAKYSKPGIPYVTYTEFVSADGLFCGDKSARGTLQKDLIYSESERPIVAQFFTARPDVMKQAARLAVELGFDGVDINMGCPDRSVEKQRAGAALIKEPELAQELVYAAKEGAGVLPVSVKTRLGYNRDELEEWLPVLLQAKPASVIIHARTRKEMSRVPARWDRVARAVAIRNGQSSDALILGNGDITDIDDARRKAEEAGADGVMLGRAVFGKPSLFHNSAALWNKDGLGVVRKTLEVLLEHTKLFEELLPHKNFAVMKKHYKAYVNGFDGAKELRAALMETKDSSDVEEVVNSFLQ